ncbi:transposase [Rubrobacter xylanophilus]|uniref:transposase n=1 Tax=Rubrobacter xylanophilus TaxID=49319 RepID=UPI0038CDB7A7
MLQLPWLSRRLTGGASAPPAVPERLNQEIRSAENEVVRIFPNREACLRLVTAIAVEQSEEWVTGRRHLRLVPPAGAQNAPFPSYPEQRAPGPRRNISRPF